MKESLINNVISGNLAEVAAIITEAPELIITKGVDRTSLLYIAAINGQTAMMQLLLDLEQKIESGALKSQDEDFEIVQPLKDCITSRGETILDAANISTNQDVIRLVYSLRPDLFKSAIDSQFGTGDKYGQVNYNGLLLASAAKNLARKSKGSNFTPVVIQAGEFEAFIKKISSIAKDSASSVSRQNIQFILNTGVGEHWISGDVEINQGKVDFVFIESLAKVSYILPLKKIIDTHIANAVIRMNFDKLQSGSRPSCAVHSFEYARMLSDQDKFTNIRQYLTEHQPKERDTLSLSNAAIREVLEETFQKAQESGIKLGYLPLRMLRDMESVSRITRRILGAAPSELQAPASSKNIPLRDTLDQSFVEQTTTNTTVNTRLDNKFKNMATRNRTLLSNPDTNRALALMNEHTVDTFVGRYNASTAASAAATIASPSLSY